MVTAEGPVCTACGAPLSDAGVAEGLCGRCLVRLAIDADDETTDRIGPYRLVEKIAEGGMGVVWKAEQQAPVRRTVAIKLIRPGLDSAQVLARFDAERQALALMDHPGIARIHDAGATDDGRPYFVMEYVAGEPVTAYCDRRRLGTQERLDLFLEICDAVQHAHHKGVVHRDIKPSNLLVGEREGKPAIKVIDFGIAKATQIRLTDRTLETLAGVAVGTPEYMSPEQASGGGLDVDTRTDVYSLGVLLYELLVGALPFDPAELRQAALDEVCRRIREEEPPRPSTRVGSLGAKATTSAHNRRTEPPALVKLLRGDLDWIVMKALEKDRERRYASPLELASDLARHMAHEPVLAGPPSAAYRTRKFVQRHRVGVAIATAVAVALVLGIVGTTYGLVRATAAERQARRNASTAERVSDFLVGLFEMAEPNRAAGKTVSARELVDAGARKIETELKDEPEIRGRILTTFGRVYRNLGSLDRSETMLREAIAIAERRGDPHQTAFATVHLGYALYSVNRYDEAERYGLKALDLWTRGSAADLRWEAEALYLLGIIDSRRGRLQPAEARLKRAWDLMSTVPNAPLTDRVTVGLELALVQKESGRGDDFVTRAESLLVEMQAGGLGEAPIALVIERLIAWELFSRRGMEAEAEHRCRDVLSRMRAASGDTQFVTDVLETLGLMLDQRRKYTEAVAVRRDLVETSVKVYGAEHPWTLVAALWEVQTLRRAARRDEAASRAKSLAQSLDRPGAPAPLRAAVGCYEGIAARWSGREHDAQTRLAECVSSMDSLRAEADQELVRSVFLDLSSEECAAGRLDTALEHLRRAIAHGYRASNLSGDPDFVPLRTHPGFPAVVAAAAP